MATSRVVKEDEKGKGKVSWLSAVAYKSMPFRTNGYGKVPLLELQHLMTKFPAVLHLAKRNLSIPLEIDPLKKEKSQARFHVHFLSKMFLSTTEKEDPEYLQLLKDLSSFYETNVDPTHLFKNMFWNKKCDDFFEPIFDHHSTVHIVITALSGNEESPPSKCVPIAAVSFCCNEKINGAYFILVLAVSGDHYTKEEYGTGSDGHTWRGRKLGSFLLDVSAQTYISVVHDTTIPIKAFTFLGVAKENILEALSISGFHPSSEFPGSLYHKYLRTDQDVLDAEALLPYCSNGVLYCKKCKLMN